MNLFFTRPGRLSRAAKALGFSLPETTIAVAIAALGIVSVMGLIPQGLETAHKTSNLNAESRIMTEIIGELQNEDWSKFIATGTVPNRTYDDQGILISNGVSSSGSVNSMTTYVAQIQVSTVLLPGSSSTAGVGGEPYLRRLTVNIVNSSNPSYSFPPSDAARFKTVSFLLTKLQ